MLLRRPRPRFVLDLPMSAADAMDRIEAHLARQAATCGGMIARNHGHVDLRMPQADRRFFSPHLSMEITDLTDRQACRVNALIGPNPSVWTFFAFAMLGLLTALAFALTFGLVQVMLEESPWALWLSGGVVLLIGATYGLSRFGQHLAAPQTVVLRHFLEGALGLDDAERARTEVDPYHEDIEVDVTPVEADQLSAAP
jgi:hypothetical protein